MQHAEYPHPLTSTRLLVRQDYQMRRRHVLIVYCGRIQYVCEMETPDWTLTMLMNRIMTVVATFSSKDCVV